MFRAFLLVLFFAASNQAPECYDPPNGSPPRGLLCGNGVLDPGEVCDDGNQINFDGCNAFCSAFDAMPAASTLAGGTTACPGGKTPVLGGTTSQVQFCNLRAVDTALDGSYVVLADGGTMLRYDLFTDNVKGTIRQLEASIDHVFSDKICSVGVLAPDAAILMHDCGAQQLYIAMGDDGSHVQLVADWSNVFVTDDTFKAHYNKEARTAVVAGTLLQEDRGLIEVQLVNISAFDKFFAASSVVSLATIQRTVYNVWEGGGIKRPSMDMVGMQPRAVLYENCPPTFRALQMCYTVYLERAAQMEFMRVYIPENGGFDMDFYSYTTSLMDNALGHPMVRHSGALSYSLRGACFQIESRIISPDGKAPPIITLGNACKQAPRLGIKCSLPLNNPFITDVITTPILLPDGLSVTHTHAEMTQIFSATCVNASAGPRMYQSVLRAAYAQTLPVDFVELAGILDVVYITPTSVGLISTKRLMLYDRTQPGYVRATNLINCPKGSFGSVGGVCAPCADFKPTTTIPVSYQIQCADDGSDFETFTVVASKNVSADDVHQGVCIYTAAKNGTCPQDVSIASPQPFNMAADALDAAITNDAPTSLVRCLMADAERTTGRSLFRPNSAEYNARVVAQGRHILSADGISANYSGTAKDCKGTLFSGVGGFLKCAIQKTTTTQGGRRLLQVNDVAPQLTEHQGTSVASNNPISWNKLAPDVAPGVAPPPSTRRDASGDGGFPIWAIILIVSLACAAVLLVVAYLLFHNSMRRPKRS